MAHGARQAKLEPYAGQAVGYYPGAQQSGPMGPVSPAEAAAAKQAEAAVRSPCPCAKDSRARALPSPLQAAAAAAAADAAAHLDSVLARAGAGTKRAADPVDEFLAGV